MREIRRTSAFKHHYKIMERRGKDMNKLHEVIRLLALDLSLPQSLKDH